VREAVAAQLSGTLGEIARLPVDRACGVFHEQPPAAAERPAQVGRHGQPDVVVRLLGGQVVVVGDDVDLACPLPQVHGLAVDGHEVGRHGNGRVGGLEDVALQGETRQVLVAGEAREVEALGGIDDGVAAAGRVDLRPIAVTLAPEQGSPRVVEAVEIAIGVPEPTLERCNTGLAVALAQRRAVLVMHVP
jgi:hypothetical protein